MLSGAFTFLTAYNYNNLAASLVHGEIIAQLAKCAAMSLFVEF